VLDTTGRRSADGGTPVLYGFARVASRCYDRDVRLACLPAVIVAAAIVVAPPPSAADATVPQPPPGKSELKVDLVVLSRDGTVQRVVGAAGEARVLGKFPGARAMATLSGGRVAVLTGAKLQILDEQIDERAWRAVPGDYADVKELAGCNARLYLATADRADQLDLRTGKRENLMKRADGVHLLCGGDQLYYVHEGIIQSLAGPGGWPGWVVPGRHVRALAANGAQVFVATREGPLWSFDFTRGEQRDLGMGGWWGTLALAADGSGLYAVTQAGKLWHIDPAKSVKTIIAMSGWEGALALAVSR